MNILITGKPGVGKTTFIRKIVEATGTAWGGFYTQGILEKKKRIGFRIVTLDGRFGTLAHVKYPGQVRVGKYRVNVHDLESIAVTSIEKAIIEKKPIIVDEIGKIEIVSTEFKRIINIALNTKQTLLGTISLFNNAYLSWIRKREDVMFVELTKDNRKILQVMVLDLLIKDGIKIV